MKFFPDEFLFTLLEKNPVAEEFRQFHIELNECSHGFACSCPFHSETGKSCIIYPETHNFSCSVCGAGGDVVTFLMLMQKLSYQEAVQILAERSGLQIPKQSPEEARRILRQRECCYEINRETANFYYKNLLTGSDKRGLAYLTKRKLSPQTVRSYGLGYAPDDWHQLQNYLTKKGYSEEELILANVCRKSENGNVYDNFRNRVIFPIMDMQRHVIGFGGRVLDDSKPKYLNTSDTPVFDKGRNLFSLQFAGQNTPGTLILAEGYMDVIALYQAGFRNAVATLGTAITPQQARLIAQYADTVIISYDSDNAGQNATQKAIRHFHAVGLPAKILHIDEDAKDPDEYIKQFGAERFRLLLKNAKNATDFQLDRCRSGLDLKTENGKISYLRQSVKVLSEIGNAKEQEVYLHRTAQELHIRPEVLKDEIIKFRKKQEKRTSDENFHDNIEKQFHIRDEINPQAREHLKENESEELLLAALMWHPEQADAITSRLSPEDFITDFHRKIYQILCRILPGCTWFIPSMTGDCFSAEEMCRITRIFIYYRDKINPDVIDDCICNLHSAQNQMTNISNLSDNDLLQVFANKKKNIRFTY